MPTISRIAVCSDSGCLSGGGQAVCNALRAALEQRGLAHQVEVRTTGCFGFCEQGPIVIMHPGETFYVRLRPKDAEDIIEQHVIAGKVVERLLYRHPVTQAVLPTAQEMGFYQKQQRRILRRCGIIDPERIEDYVASDGYQALTKALKSMTPGEVIDEVERSEIGRASCRERV